MTACFVLGSDIGIMTALGLVVCCGLPVLLAAGAIAASGGFLRSP